jgi:hypothetical protein
MPSRRISSNGNLAPVQEIAVSPYSSYNSDNVNMLTRIVTGEKNKDFISKGLDTKGVNRVNTEVIDAVIFTDAFPSLISFNANWTPNAAFSWDSVTQSALAEILSGHKTETCILQSKTTISPSDIGKWFKVEFTLVNTPKQLYIQLGSESKTYDHPHSGRYSFYIQYYENNGSHDPLTFVAFLDDEDPYSDHSIYLGDGLSGGDVTLTRIANRGTLIEPIALPEAESPDNTTSATLNHTDIPLIMLHPHESLKVFPGVAIKDEAMINILGLNPADTNLAAVDLTYNDPDSWINGVPFGPADFPVSATSYYYTEAAGPLSTGFDAFGELTTTLVDDGEGAPGTFVKINGQSASHADPAYVKWAYVVLYYSFFKNPDPNKSYIGLATEAEVADPRYGEDFLILAKLRFVDVSTVDAIIYYPDRKDWGFIDARNVTYLYLNQLKHWLTKPYNVSLALDLLAQRIYNFKGVLFFPTHQQFILWKNDLGGSATGTGHGPLDYIQWTGGIDADNGYDLLAYVVETRSFWRSQIQLTGSVQSVEIVEAGSGYTPGLISVNVKAVVGGTVIETVNATVNGSGNITSVVTPAFTSYIATPDLIINPPAVGTQCVLRAVMSPVITGYKVVINWYELTQKTFELEWWSLYPDHLWPYPVHSIPSDWKWEGTTIPSVPTIENIEAAWPNGYYYVESPDPGHIGKIKVNPFNCDGTGMVPAPVTDEVITNKFLRADGTWQFGGENKISFYIQGYMLAGANVGESLLVRDTIFNKVQIAIDQAPGGTATGSTVTSASVHTAGSGYTPGGYTTSCSFGFGVGGQLHYTVGSNGTIISTVVSSPGSIYNIGHYTTNVLPGGIGGRLNYIVGIGDLVLYFYRKYWSAGIWNIEAEPFAVSSFFNATPTLIQTISFENKTFFSGDILLVRCIGTGISPTEGGVDTKITLYQV